jgi:hypothetical protein
VWLYVFYSGISAAFLDDPVTDAQAQSRYVADGFRGIERIKRPVQIPKTWSRVFDFYTARNPLW